MKFNVPEMQGKSQEIVQELTSMYSLLEDLKDSWLDLSSNKDSWDSQTADYFASIANSLYDINADFSSLKGNIDAYFQSVIGNYQRVNEQLSSGSSFSFTKVVPGSNDWW